MVSNTRLYGGTIAIVSGVYSLWSAAMASRMVASAWLMVVLGAVVFVHGVVLFIGYAARLKDASGPFMIGYAVVMLLNQALLATGVIRDGSGMGVGMNGGMGMGGSAMTAGMGWDAGMVALAALMLASGMIMARNGPMDDARGGM